MQNYFFLRLTDLCEYCEKEIVFKKKITRVLEDTFENYQKGSDILSLKNECRLKAKNIKTIINNTENEQTEIKERLEANYEKLKATLDDLRDYEVRFHFISLCF